jgi:hypothetical protein
MSGLRRFNRREFLGATAAAVGAGTGGLSQISGAPFKTAVKTGYISPYISMVKSRSPLLLWR